jgi:transcriptional regulator with XRE-family HTH domain
MTINKQLGARIRYLRQQKNMTIEDLALEAEINRNYLCDLERGTRNPTVVVLNKIAKP